MIYPDEKIERILLELCEALHIRKQTTGKGSILILREENQFPNCFRAVSGDFKIPLGVFDKDLLKPFQQPIIDEDGWQQI